MTSHIDLTPSILDLIGVTEGRDFELGSPMWDERIGRRATFFWANEYLGADGFHQDGQYYMWRSMSDTFYHSSVFEFHDARPDLKERRRAKFVTGKIEEVMALQHRIMDLGSKNEEVAGAASLVRAVGFLDCFGVGQPIARGLAAWHPRQQAASICLLGSLLHSDRRGGCSVLTIAFGPIASIPAGGMVSASRWSAAGRSFTAPVAVRGFVADRPLAVLRIHGVVMMMVVMMMVVMMMEFIPRFAGNPMAPFSPFPGAGPL